MFPKADNVKTLEASLFPFPISFPYLTATSVLISSSGKSAYSGISSTHDPLVCTLPSVLAAFLQHVILGDPSVLQHVPTGLNFLHYC